MFGITVERVRNTFFSHSEPFSEHTKPTLSAATEIVEGSGSEVLLILNSKGIDPNTIDETRFPYAYKWLADTLSLAAAARIAQIGAIGVESDAVSSWITDYNSRKEFLIENSALLFPVVSKNRVRTGGFLRDPSFLIEDEN